MKRVLLLYWCSVKVHVLVGNLDSKLRMSVSHMKAEAQPLPAERLGSVSPQRTTSQHELYLIQNGNKISSSQTEERTSCTPHHQQDFSPCGDSNIL